MTRFPIPDTALARHIANVGETGSGKTHDSKAIVEHVVDEGYRVCVLDTIKSDWWGITSSASGKRPGLPFKILGGPRGHIPLHSGAGKAIGQLVGEGKLPLSIIDMADFEPGGPQKFFEHFAQALWKHTRGVIYLVIEEAHELAPKERAGFGAENMAIHWAKKLATGSRTKGIRLIVSTQRTQALHNAILGSCGTVIVHSLSYPADQEPVQKWLKANVMDKALIAKIDDEMASLPTGTAWVCNAKDKFFEKIKFPKITTFDNTATPDKDVDEIEVETAAVNADELRAIIGDAVKDAEANDPKALKAKIAQLTAENAKLAKAKPSIVNEKSYASLKERERAFAAGVKQAQSESAPLAAHNKKLVAALEAAMKFIVEINATDFFKAGGDAIDKKAIEKVVADATERATKLIEAHIDRRNKELELVRRKGEQLSARLKALLEQDVSVRVDVKHNEPFTVSAPKVACSNPASDANGDGRLTEGLSRPQQRILDALAWLATIGIESADRPRAGMLADQSHRSSGFEKNVSTLKTKGLIDYPGSGLLALTAEGKEFANTPDALPTTEDLHRAIASKVSRPQWKMLVALCDVYPNALTRDELGERSEQSPLSSGFEKNVSTLKSFGFISYPDKGQVAATEFMFVDGGAA